MDFYFLVENKTKNLATPLETAGTANIAPCHADKKSQNFKKKLNLKKN